MFKTIKTTGNRAVLNPDQIQDLLVLPVTTDAVAAQVSTVVRTLSNVTRFPRLISDPTAAWTSEGDEIDPSDPVFDEVEVNPSKLAGLVITTAEMMRDSSTEAMNQVGSGLVRQITNSIDAAFFGALDAPAPQGLPTIGATELDVATTNNLDWVEQARATAANNGATLTSFVAHPDDFLTIATLKESTSSNRGLLQSDPTIAAGRTISGTPLHTSTYVTPGTVWGIPKGVVNLIVRDDAEVIADSSAYFTSDRVAIRGTMRVGFGFIHPEGIVKINLNTGG